MSSGKRSRVGRNVVKPLVVAVALALPGAASFAASMTDVVMTRSDQNIDEQYGRDSVYAFSRDAKPLKPEQTGSREPGWLDNTVGKTKTFVAGAWDKTTHLFKGDGSSSYSSAVAYQPQPYGRAGGYAGSDRVAVLSTAPAAMATANSEVVKTGQEWGNAADTRARSDIQRDGESPSAAVGVPDESSAAINDPGQGAADQAPASTTGNSLSQEQSEPSTAAPVVKETIIEERTVIVAPAPDSSAVAPTEPTPVEPQDQSAATDSNVVRSTQPAATDDDDSSNQTR